MQSKASTPAQYLAELPADRRADIAAVRKVILANLDRDYEEGMQYGMIGYYVPHRIFPAGYHCDPRQPLPFAALASQRNYMSLYLMPLYGDPALLAWFKKAWAATGRKIEMGKSCIRFRSVDELALDIIGEMIRRVPARKFIDFCVSVTGARSQRKASATKSSAKNPVTRTVKKPAGKPRSAARVKRAAKKVTRSARSK